jgi:hypothetical protein
MTQLYERAPPPAHDAATHDTAATHAAATHAANDAEPGLPLVGGAAAPAGAWTEGALFARLTFADAEALFETAAKLAAPVSGFAYMFDGQVRLKVLSRTPDGDHVASSFVVHGNELIPMPFDAAVPQRFVPRPLVALAVPGMPLLPPLPSALAAA